MALYDDDYSSNTSVYDDEPEVNNDDSEKKYIFISYAEHLDKGSKYRGDYYNASLIYQYKLLKKRIPPDRQIDYFEDFIEACFPSVLNKKYYLSCPNILREMNNSGNALYLNNVVLRPELTLEMKSVLPDNQNVILIGDICVSDRLGMFQVKGIQLIDSSMSSPKDFVIRDSSACNSFKKNYWSINPNDENTVFTPNFVASVIEGCWTVKNPEKIKLVYDLWKKYIDFRNYYLDEQSKRHFKLDRALFVNAYAVNKKTYEANKTDYEGYLLDGRDEFGKGDMILLSEKIGDAEEFPLIRLDIERTKKEFDEKTKVSEKGKRNEEEIKIRSLSRDNVFITREDPKGISHRIGDKGYDKLLKDGYVLGDRFKILKYDIEPAEHLTRLQDEYDVKVKESGKIIDAKYNKIIKDELDEAVKSYKNKLQTEADVKISAKEKELNDSLENDIKSNDYSAIKDLINKKKTEITVAVLKNNRKDKKENNKEYEERLKLLVDKELSNIDVRALYLERNEKELNDFKKRALSENNDRIFKYKSEKESEFRNKYANEISNEKRHRKEELDAELEREKDRIIKEETVIRFSLYFKLRDESAEIRSEHLEKIKACEYIVYDNRAEKAKIKRQELALKNFFNGYVKNPYLSTYLFSSGELDAVGVETDDWIWYLDSLNDKQKEAVRKAVSSNGLFLLQGPPGTGKTQVIAETVVHLVKMGKKVLVSSETHKAIDNVFERLPKVADIVPVRLIPSHNEKKKDNNYDPEFLVKNFYSDIEVNLRKAVERYESFEAYKNDFDEDFEKLRLLKSKLEKTRDALDKAKGEIKGYEDDRNKISSEKSVKEDEREEYTENLRRLERTKRNIKRNNLGINDIDEDDIKSDEILSYINDYINELKPLFADESIFGEDHNLDERVRNIVEIEFKEVESELAKINPESDKIKLEIQIAEIRAKIAGCRNEYEDILPGKEEECEKYKKVLKDLINKRNNSNIGDESSLKDLKLSRTFDTKYLVENKSLISEKIRSLKKEIRDIQSKYIGKLDNEITSVDYEKSKLDKEIKSLKREIDDLSNKIAEINDRKEIQEIKKSESELRDAINKFFKDFEISEPYTDIDDALEIIETRWFELKADFEKKEQENKEKIPMYKKIAEYIADDEVIEADKNEFTKDLFENANVFGITCTSRDNFSGETVDALDKYNIDDFDIKSSGIDVVIIDEVSKTSFLDLLIPILYGKTVILVGDHRQLPPMYDLKHLRSDDFEGLDEEIISIDLNRIFTYLYEECYFKTLFEKTPDSHKTMLVQQYRCHEDIMRVFNHFYRGKLKLGFEGQNNLKSHNVELRSDDGRPIIEPDKHIYFVDCREKETRDTDSTSIYNMGEARVVVELIKKLNDYFKSHQEYEKLSIGVICTYGDQAGKIKKLMRSEKVKTDAFKTDAEKMIVSTVDDFQGDERDIIILTTVRNPADPKKSKPGFILAYQRINVALSRARRMLIMVGNKKYLESKGEIKKLPDVYGRPDMDQRNFRVYEEILADIGRYGRVLDDTDVLENKGGKING